MPLFIPSAGLWSLNFRFCSSSLLVKDSFSLLSPYLKLCYFFFVVVSWEISKCLKKEVKQLRYLRWFGNHFSSVIFHATFLWCRWNTWYAKHSYRRGMTTLGLLFFPPSCAVECKWVFCIAESVVFENKQVLFRGADANAVALVWQ